MKEFWNSRFGASQTEYVYGTAPNVFFEQELGKLEPGRLLLAAEGEGRNAVFAARKGWQVTAFDISEAGKKKAQQLAREFGVEAAITYELAGFDTFEAPEDHFDVLGLCYAHISSSQRRAVHRRLAGMLKPGGMVILEAFSKDQLGRDSGGPQNEKMLYSHDAVAVDFEGFQQLQGSTEEVELAEGRFHAGRASVVRFTGLKI
ncbi:MAG: class I SAM-dependent methyltransferase [Cyclonatronaceae bacterium]